MRLTIPPSVLPRLTIAQPASAHAGEVCPNDCDRTLSVIPGAVSSSFSLTEWLPNRATHATAPPHPLSCGQTQGENRQLLP